MRTTCLFRSEGIIAAGVKNHYRDASPALCCRRLDLIQGQAFATDIILAENLAIHRDKEVFPSKLHPVTGIEEEGARTWLRPQSLPEGYRASEHRALISAQEGAYGPAQFLKPLSYVLCVVFRVFKISGFCEARVTDH